MSATPRIEPGTASQHREDVRVVLAGHGEAVDQEAEEDRAEDRAEEGADDPRPEAVGDEDREVPEGEAHHGPGERAHQRGLPCLPRRLAAADGAWAWRRRRLGAVGHDGVLGQRVGGRVELGRGRAWARLRRRLRLGSATAVAPRPTRARRAGRGPSPRTPRATRPARGRRARSGARCGAARLARADVDRGARRRVARGTTPSFSAAIARAAAAVDRLALLPAPSAPGRR